MSLVTADVFSQCVDLRSQSKGLKARVLVM